jgi:hypothetical protein
MFLDRLAFAASYLISHSARPRSSAFVAVQHHSGLAGFGGTTTAAIATGAVGAGSAEVCTTGEAGAACATGVGGMSAVHGLPLATIAW